MLAIWLLHCALATYSATAHYTLSPHHHCPPHHRPAILTTAADHRRAIDFLSAEACWAAWIGGVCEVRPARRCLVLGAALGRVWVEGEWEVAVGMPTLCELADPVLDSAPIGAVSIASPNNHHNQEAIFIDSPHTQEQDKEGQVKEGQVKEGQVKMGQAEPTRPKMDTPFVAIPIGRRSGSSVGRNSDIPFVTILSTPHADLPKLKRKASVFNGTPKSKQPNNVSTPATPATPATAINSKTEPQFDIIPITPISKPETVTIPINPTTHNTTSNPTTHNNCVQAARLCPVPPAPTVTW